MELAKAVRDLPRPIYVHCHHGKHRSPTAAAVACVTLGWLPEQDATIILQTAGTSERYQGLYQAAERAHPVDSTLLDDLPVEYPEIAELPKLAETMVETDRIFEHLKQLAANSWTPSEAHPDLDPAHEALMLREMFAELLRNGNDAESNRQRFVDLLTQAESHAMELETALTRKPSDFQTATKALERVDANCNACHKEFRDVPLVER